MIRVNVSEVLDYQTCPSLWASRWVFRRRACGARSGALDLGTAFHAVVAEALLSPAVGPSWFAGRISSRLSADWLQRGLMPDPDAIRDAGHLEIWASRLWENRPWSRVLGAEVLIEAPLAVDPEVSLFGRLDAVVEIRGSLRHLQWKTAAASTNLPVYAAVIQRSLHESAYGFLGQTKYGPSFFGTLLLAVRKVSHHSRAAGQTCEDCGEKGYQAGRPLEHAVLWSDMVIGEGRMERAQREIAAVAREMEAERARLLSVGTRMAPLPIIQHTRECGGKFGNSLCQYAPVCDGETTIDDGIVFEAADPLASYRTEGE